MADLSPAPGTAAARPHGLDVVTGSKPRPDPLDPPMVPFVLSGMAIFAVAAVVVLIAGGPDFWLWTCVAGAAWGIPALLAMLRHDANRRERRALSHPEFTVDDPA